MLTAEGVHDSAIWVDVLKAAVMARPESHFRAENAVGASN